jgi:hypothetical protein
MNITYNITTLIGSAKTNGLAYFTAWYNSICAALGITPIATPGDFFAPSTSGDYVDFGAFLTSVQSPLYAGLATGSQVQMLQGNYAVVSKLYSLAAFAALAPTTIRVSDETYDWLNNIINIPMPTDDQLAVV